MTEGTPQASGNARSRLERFIETTQISARIVRPGADTPTVPAAAAALGVEPDQIIKSLLFQGKDGDCVVAIVRGTGKVDRRKLSQVTGLRKPQLAPADVVLERTGYEAGGTPPIGYVTELAVVIDPAVFETPVVFGGGGAINAMLEINPETIRELTGATVADICQAD